MKKEDYIKTISDDLTISDAGKMILLDQIDKFYEIKNKTININRYEVGEIVKLKKGTLLHGTYKNIRGLRKIVKEGLVTKKTNRESKYSLIVDVWNLKKNYILNDYINFYSGGTILFRNDNKNNTRVIPYNKMQNFIDYVKKVKCHMWVVEQTKEARFLPSLVQDKVQIGIIINGDNKYTKELLKYDILNPKKVDDKTSKDFVNPKYYNQFLRKRKRKDDFFTDRESAVVFGIPSNLIEGIIVGRIYEKNKKMLNEIKKLLPDAYISNLKGKVIVGNKLEK